MAKRAEKKQEVTFDPVPWVGVCRHCAKKYGEKAEAGFIFFVTVLMECFHCGKKEETLDKGLLEVLKGGR